MGSPNGSHETKFSGTNRDKNTLIVQLTARRIGNHTQQRVHTLLVVLTIHNACILLAASHIVMFTGFASIKGAGKEGRTLTEWSMGLPE